MSDEFRLIERDEHGPPKIRYCLDPREVTVIRDPERDGEVIGYIWEPVGPAPQPIRTDPQLRLTAAEIEDLKQRFEGIDVHSIDMEERRGPRRRWWRRRP